MGIIVNSLPFVGKVLGYGRTYKYGGGGHKVGSRKLPNSVYGVCIHRAGTDRGGGVSVLYHDAPPPSPHFQVGT